MKEINSTDYHDFVFRDGKLVGEFEQMYQKSAEVPWLQDRVPTRMDCRVAVEFLACHSPFQHVVEIGCGLGYFAEMVRQRVQPDMLTAFDIAPSAVAAARGLFSAIQFDVLDITDPVQVRAKGLRADLVIIRGCFGYLFEQPGVVIDNLHALTAPGGQVFVAQNFPPLDSKFVGKEVLPNPASLIHHFERRFHITATNELKERRADAANDHWIMFVGKPRTHD